jgi:hypothetical protein
VVFTANGERYKSNTVPSLLKEGVETIPKGSRVETATTRSATQLKFSFNNQKDRTFIMNVYLYIEQIMEVRMWKKLIIDGKETLYSVSDTGEVRNDLRNSLLT